MVDRIRKILQKMALKDRASVTEVMGKILLNQLAGLDVKKLQGREDAYRVRKGNFRIIFRKQPGLENVILIVDRRSEDTYE